MAKLVNQERVVVRILVNLLSCIDFLVWRDDEVIALASLLLVRCDAQARQIVADVFDDPVGVELVALEKLAGADDLEAFVEEDLEDQVAVLEPADPHLPLGVGRVERAASL